MNTTLQKVFVMLALLSALNEAAATGTTVFPIATNASMAEISGGIATSGSNSLVGILAGTNVCVQLVSSNGTLVGPLVTIGQSEGYPRVAFGGNNYLAIWEDDFDLDPNDFGQIISGNGVTVGPAFSLESSGAVQALASDGTNFLAVTRGGTNYYYGQIVTPAGTLSGPQFLITSQQQNGNSAAATFGKTNYLVVWQSGNGIGNTNNQTFGEFVSVNGSAGSPFQIGQTASTDEGKIGAVSVAFDGTNYLVLWDWDPGPETEMSVTNWQIYGRLVSQTGTFPGSELALITNGNQVVPTLAFDGANYLLTYGFDSNTTNSDINLRCRFLDRSANLVGAIFTPFAAQGTNLPLFAISGILFDGTRFNIAATLGTLNASGSLASGEVFCAFIPASTTSPTLASTGLLIGSQFPLLLTGTPGINYTIQLATNLPSSNWTAVVTNSPTNGTFTFTDTQATNKSRFYRAEQQ